MGFTDYLKLGVRIVKPDRDAISEVASDEGALKWAVLFVAIGGLADAVREMLTHGKGYWVFIEDPLSAVISNFLFIGVFHLVAKQLGGTGGFKGYFCALGIGSITNWALVLPYVGWPTALWGLPVMVVVTSRVYGLSTGKAIAVFLIPIVILLAITLVRMALGMAA